MLRIIKYELLKILNNKFLIIAAAVFIGILLFSNIYYALSDPNHFGNLNEFYEEFYKGNEGPVSLADYQKSEAVVKDYEKGIKLSDNIIEDSRKYHFNYDLNFRYEDNEQFEEYRNSYKNGAEKELKLLGSDNYYYKQEKLHTDMVLSQPLPQVFFTLPWINTANITYAAFVAAVLIVLGISPVFSSDYSKNTDSLIFTSKKGRHTDAAAKVLAAVIFSAMTALLFTALYSLSSIALYGVHGYNAPMQNLWFNSLNCCYNLTVLQFFFIKILFAVFGCIALGLITLFLSSLFKNQIIPFFTAIIIFGIPFVFERLNLINRLHGMIYAAITSVSDFSYIKLIHADGFFSLFKTYNIFGFPVLSCFVVPVVFLILTFIFVLLTHICYKNHNVD